jgi:hypothetical protein
LAPLKRVSTKPPSLPIGDPARWEKIKQCYAVSYACFPVKIGDKIEVYKSISGLNTRSQIAMQRRYSFSLSVNLDEVWHLPINDLQMRDS